MACGGRLVASGLLECSQHVLAIFPLLRRQRFDVEWLEIFGDTSVPTIVVNTLDGLTKDPHLDAVDFWQMAEHPTEGTLRMASFPVNFSSSPATLRSLPPRLGEDSVEILREAGLSQDDIDAMLATGATRAAD